MPPLVDLTNALRRTLQSRRIILTALSTSVLNQAVSSGVNFVVGVYLARVLAPAEFGFYGIGLAAVLLYAGICNALFITQMVVHLPGKDEIQRVGYVSRIHNLVLVFCATFALLSLTCLVVLELYGSHVYLGLTAATLAAAVAYVIKDFFVRLAYSYYRERVVLYVNLGIATGTIGALAALRSQKASFDAVDALWSYAFGQISGAAIGAAYFRLPWQSALSIRMLRNEMAETWVHGRWSLAGAAVIWTQTQAYVLVSAAAIGPAGVGVANAAKLFISPFLFLSPAINQLVLPRLSKLRMAAPRQLVRIGRSYGIAMSLLAALYLAALWLGFTGLKLLVLGEKYPQLGWIVAAWGIVLLSQMFREGASVTLQALMQFKSIFKRNVISAIVVCSSALLLSTWLGVAGAVFALAIGEVVLGLFLWQKLKSIARSARS